MVVQLNSKETLHWLTEKINKRVGDGGGNEKDVRELMSICYRHLRFHLDDNARKVNKAKHSVMLNHEKPIMVLTLCLCGPCLQTMPQLNSTVTPGNS